MLRLMEVEREPAKKLASHSKCETGLEYRRRMVMRLFNITALFVLPDPLKVVLNPAGSDTGAPGCAGCPCAARTRVMAGDARILMLPYPSWRVAIASGLSLSC